MSAFGLARMLVQIALAVVAVFASCTLAAVPDAALGEIVKSMVVDNVPLVSEERKGWGDQVRVFDGFHFRGKGLKVKTEVRKKAVNHGLWQYYRVAVVDPKRDLSIQFPRLEYVEGEGIRFAVLVQARLHGYADFKQFNNGLKLYSAATEGDFDVSVLIQGLIGVSFVPNGLQSEFHFTPKVESVALAVPNIDVERFGKIKGNLAQETGDSFRKIIEKRVQKEAPDVAAKMNRAIQKEIDRGKLKFSLQDLVREKRG